jgi:hypothetical protein
LDKRSHFFEIIFLRFSGCESCNLRFLRNVFLDERSHFSKIIGEFLGNALWDKRSHFSEIIFLKFLGCESCNLRFLRNVLLDKKITFSREVEYVRNKWEQHQSFLLDGGNDTIKNNIF